MVAIGASRDSYRHRRKTFSIVDKLKSVGKINFVLEERLEVFVQSCVREPQV